MISIKGLIEEPNCCRHWKNVIKLFIYYKQAKIEYNILKIDKTQLCDVYDQNKHPLNTFTFIACLTLSLGFFL